MTDAKLAAYRIAGELYGKLRANLIGGRLTMVYEGKVDTIDYRWTIRKKRKEYTVNQCVKLDSLAEADEIDSLFDAMLQGLNKMAEQVAP